MLKYHKNMLCSLASIVSLATLVFIGTKPAKAAIAPEKTNTYQTLAITNYRVGNKAYDILNNDQPETIGKYKFDKSKINFSKLDYLNRAGTATAYLTKNNLGKSKNRAPQVFKPTGWYNQPKKINGKRVFPVNRGHLIAYSLSFNLNNNGKNDNGKKGSIDNPKNLFTQSAFANQKVMTINENMVRDALKANKKVVYQVTPIYYGSDAMARGVWVQATSTDGTMHFNRYLYNVQPEMAFNYATGRSYVDQNMYVPNPVSYNNYRPRKIKKWHTNYRHHAYRTRKVNTNFKF